MVYGLLLVIVVLLNEVWVLRRHIVLLGEARDNFRTLWLDVRRRKNRAFMRLCETEHKFSDLRHRLRDQVDANAEIVKENAHLLTVNRVLERRIDDLEIILETTDRADP